MKWGGSGRHRGARRYLRAPLIRRLRMWTRSVIHGGRSCSWIGGLRRRSCELGRSLGGLLLLLMLMW